MYAVIKTGGKQYRVSPGDLMVVEKLAGEPGAKVSFGDVLMVGEGEAVTIGSPTVAGASVSATLVETRKGEKVKIFKKIRRQGYRRTRGHRQHETALRVIGITGADGKEVKWDGKVDLTSKGELDARARGLTYISPAAQAEAAAAAKIQTPRKGAGTAKAAPVKKAAAPKPAAKAEDADVKAAAKAAQINAPVPEAKAETKAAPAKTAAPAPKAAAKPAPKAAEAKKAAAPAKASAKPAAKAEPAPKKAAAPAEKKAAAPKKAAAAPKKDKPAK